MKRVILSLALLLGVSCAYAQPSYSVQFTSADTLTNADTVVANLSLSSSLDGIILQPMVNRISGTAAGKIVLLQSLNGVDYVRTDSVTLSNVVKNATFITKTGAVAPFFRVEFVSSGTTVLFPQLVYFTKRNK
jgi:PBP1b-binding outer membrane lipoprotein LpoB